MNFLQIIAIFFNEKKQIYWLNEDGSSDRVYNVNFIRKYKLYNNIKDDLSSEELLFAYEFPLIFGACELVLGLTYSYFISMFNIELYISSIILFAVALIISFFSAKINLFKKKHTQLSPEYIAIVQKKILSNVITMNTDEDITNKTTTNRL